MNWIVVNLGMWLDILLLFTYTNQQRMLPPSSPSLLSWWDWPSLQGNTLHLIAEWPRLLSQSFRASDMFSQYDLFLLSSGLLVLGLYLTSLRKHSPLSSRTRSSTLRDMVGHYTWRQSTTYYSVGAREIGNEHLLGSFCFTGSYSNLHL